MLHGAFRRFDAAFIDKARYGFFRDTLIFDISRRLMHATEHAIAYTCPY